MKAWLFVTGWVAVGAFLAFRPGSGRRGAEAALVLLFWPFFLAQAPPRAGARAVDPLVRLRSALGEDPGAQVVADELECALDGVRDRLARVDRALTEISSDGDGAVGEARATSRLLLEEAQQRSRAELDEALAAIEEAATRLVLARESREAGQVDAILTTLRDRLLAVEEVEAWPGCEHGERERSLDGGR